MLYYQNEITQLYNGDCIEVMSQLVADGIKVDKIITSPPYNIIRPEATDRGYDVYQDRLITNDEYIDWTLKVFECYDKLLNPNGCICYNLSYGTENTEAMSLTVAEIIKQTEFTLADVLVWKKYCASPNNMSCNKMTRICEFVYVFCRRSEFDTFTCNKRIVSYRETNQPNYENMFNFFTAQNNDESQELNKATFSTDFVYNLMDRYVKPTDIVLDNFSGTGTTMIACESRDVRSIGIELSKKQCAYAVKRLKRGVQLALV